MVVSRILSCVAAAVFVVGCASRGAAPPSDAPVQSEVPEGDVEVSEPAPAEPEEPCPPVDYAALEPDKRHPDTRTIALTRIFAWADSPAGAGMPATGFFDRDGTPAAGQVVAVSGADAIVIVDGGKELVKVPVASVTTAPGAKALRKGQAVVAIAGCGMNGWRPREGKVVDVIEGGIGYTVDADPCKGVTVAGNRLRAK